MMYLHRLMDVLEGILINYNVSRQIGHSTLVLDAVNHKNCPDGAFVITHNEDGARYLRKAAQNHALDVLNCKFIPYEQFFANSRGGVKVNRPIIWDNAAIMFLVKDVIGNVDTLQRSNLNQSSEIIQLKQEIEQLKESNDKLQRTNNELSYELRRMKESNDGIRK